VRPGRADYAATKGGADRPYHKSLASELGPLGVRVNCVVSRLGRDRYDRRWHSTGDIIGNPEKYQRILDAIPLRRIATSDDIAGPILFFSPLNLPGILTGEIRNVNGGSVLCG
jgi:3-oxoacyl-[acyl-carrier protein] reductase